MANVFPKTYMRGNAMKKKIAFVLLSILITAFFLFICVYYLGAAYGGQQQGAAYDAAQVTGWMAFLLFILGLFSLFVILKSDHTSI